MKVKAIGFLQFAYLFSLTLMQLVGLFHPCSSPLFYFLLEKKWQLYHVLINFELEKAKKLQTRCGFESEGDTGMKLVDQDLPWTLSSGPDNCLAREGAGTWVIE